MLLIVAFVSNALSTLYRVSRVLTHFYASFYFRIMASSVYYPLIRRKRTSSAHQACRKHHKSNSTSQGKKAYLTQIRPDPRTPVVFGYMTCFTFCEAATQELGVLDDAKAPYQMFFRSALSIYPFNVQQPLIQSVTLDVALRKAEVALYKKTETF